MSSQTLFLFFVISLSILSTHSVSAFPKTHAYSSRQKLNQRNHDDVLTDSSEDSPPSSSSSSSSKPVVANNNHSAELSDVILNLKGGSTRVFPPPLPIPFVQNTPPKPATPTITSASSGFLAKYKTIILTMCLMGFSGVVEAICFRHFKMYPNMMTGNTIKGIEALTSLNWQGIQVSFGVIGSYISGCTLYRFLDRARIFKNIHSNLVWLSAISFVLFGWSDVIGMTSAAVANSKTSDLMRLLPMATAFGMINSATQDITGFVTNAATGHYGKIGYGLGESLVMNMLPQAAEADKKTLRYGIISGLSIGSFLLSMVVTNIVSLRLETKHPLLYGRLPPLGMSLGTAYAVLLSSYHYFTKPSEEKND